MMISPHLTSPPFRSDSRRANALPSGHLLEEYRIEAILGAGGFGVTYKALDTHLETWVAIKEYFPVEWSFRDADGVKVHPNTQGQTSALEGQESDYHWGLERFLDEARVLARIQHPYVVRVKRYFRAHGTAYIVMEYEEGQPLSVILRDDETLDESQIRGLLEDILPALQAVHEQGYLHRDIKPANLYLRSADHRVMLIDFGAARAAVGRHGKSVTSLVTPGYSPPEQYTTRNDRYGSWTALYALGAVLYRCVTGQVPMEAAERLLDDHMEPVAQRGAGRYSTNLLRVIDQALAVRPELRFRTVAEMQAALSGSQDQDSDETVIGPPLLAKPGAPTRETVPSQSNGRPFVPRVEQVIDIGLLEITQPHDGHSPPSDSHRTVVWHLKNAEFLQHRPLLELLLGGGVVAALAAAIVWFWPTKPILEPMSRHHYSLNQPEEFVERTADKESMAFDPFVAPAPRRDRGLVFSSESLISEGVPTESDVAVTELDALDPESAWVDGESAALPEVDDLTAPLLPDSEDQDAAAVTESPTEPTGAGSADGLPAPAAGSAAKPRSGAASESVANRRSPPRGTNTTPARSPRAGQRKGKPRSIVVTPPEWKTRFRTQASRNPWQPPTDTGFNQK
jgi:serine/threonine protein kinase